MTEQDKNKKFVIQRHLCMPHKGICFFTTNSERGRDCYSAKGELWYENVAYADTLEEVQSLIRELSVYPTFEEIYDYRSSK